MQIAEAILPIKRSAWIPVVKDDKGKLTDSKMGGAPYLLTGENYPVCPNCQNPMQFFLQLNLDQMPIELKGEFGEGLIQLFYCINEDPMCEVDCEAFFPFSKSVITRLIKIGDEDTGFPNIESESSFPSKSIVGWTQTDDYPTWEELNDLNIKADRLDYLDFLEKNDYPKSGEKLSGWPYWVQGVEYPNCRICNEAMRLVFQIDSSQNIPFDFGDVGVGHLTQCQVHKEELAFGWACG